MPDDGDGSDNHDVRLGWKDYLALFIAFVETIALPLVIVIALLLVLLIILGVVR